jgi:Sap, sulfolipid-1-addressing protein
VPGLPLQIIALALYAAFAPVAALVSILLLESVHPLRRAGAYALGYALALAGVGALGTVLVDLWTVPAPAGLVQRIAQWRPGGGTGHPELSVAIGMGMLAFAAWHWRRHDRQGVALPSWLGAVERIGTPRAFGLGALLLLANPDNVLAFLGAMNLIGDTGVDPSAALALTGLLLLTAAAPPLVPPVIYLAIPTRSGALLGALRGWIGRVSRVAVDAALVSLGAWLLLRGLAGLLA